ncbi:tol-pal system YbgF family protein [Thermodesulfobacteriota bacterium]
MHGKPPTPKINLLIRLLAVVTLFNTLSIAHSEPPPGISPDKQFAYAHSLYDEGDFENAANEYKRFVYFFPDDKRVEQARFNIGRSLFSGKRFSRAIHAFTAFIDAYRDTPLSIRSYRMISRCYIKLNQPADAAVSLYNLLSLTDDVDIRDDTYYRLGWIHLEQAKWEKAGQAFNQIRESNRMTYQLNGLFDELERRDSVIPTKEPGTAGLLSIIPGAGYLYCGRYKDALTAFLANAVLSIAAYESFDKDLNALGGLIAFIELGFYGGNIIGATAAAHKYNRYKTGQFIDHLKQHMKIDLSTDIREKRMLISFKYRF